MQLGSTLLAISATGLLNYDANDRTVTDPYDANGNLLNGGVGGNVYDFENHLVQAGGVRIVYDGDGNRVVESVGTTSTQYLLADVNPTRYVQVIEERNGPATSPGATTRDYTWGLQLISARDITPSGRPTHYYGFDGHGSVRFLMSSTGAITDTYDYDAFGNLISQTGTTANNYLFAGEQFDPALGIYYNRARYYDQRQGRFWTMDTYEGRTADPLSLHKYVYVEANPISNVDPSGLATYSQQFGYAVEAEVQKQYIQDFGNDPKLIMGKWSRLGGRDSAAFNLKPDILDLRSTRNIWMDVKPFSFSGIMRAAGTSVLYGIELGRYSIFPDTKWLNGGRLFTVGGQKVLVFNQLGILFYTTNKQDYDSLQTVMSAALGASASAALGATAGALVNSLAEELPGVSQTGSELQQINILYKSVSKAVKRSWKKKLPLMWPSK